MRRSDYVPFFAAVCCAGIGLLSGPVAVRAGSSVMVWGETSWHLDLPTDLTDVVAVSAGGDHAHALRATGQVATWSDGYSSVNPSPDLTNATAIAAGYFHSLAIHRGGSVLAWGQNTAGQTNVPSVDDAVAIAAGFRHSLALRANGTVVAWGANTNGQTDVPAGLTNVVAVSAGAYHSLALLADGRIVGWGDPRAASVPPDLTNAVAVSAGTLFSLALTRDGLVRAWGLTGNLHDRVSNTNIPVGLSNVIAVAAGTSHALALREDGTVASWGNRTTTNVPAGLNQVVAIAAGDRYSLGLRTDGPPTITSILPNRSAAFGTTVYLRVEAVGAFPLHYQWRFNGVDLPGATNPVLALANAQLHQTGAYSVTVSNSFGTTTSPDTRVEVLPIAIFAPPESQTTFKGGSALFTVTAPSPSPIHHQWLFDGVAMPGATNQTLSLADIQYSQTGRYSVTVSNELGVVSSPEALLNVVSVAVWGATDPNHTRPPADLTNAVSMANGGVFSLALKPNGTVAAWGDSTAGVLDIPPFLTDVTAVAANYLSCLALRSDGTVVAWGDNATGDREVPPGLSNVVAIAAGYAHDLALLSDGKVVGWGQSLALAGQPVDLENVVAIAAGDRFSLALRGNGTIVSWGYETPGTNVPPALGDVIALAAGSHHALALLADGTVVGWGDNAAGQVNVPSDLDGAVAIAAGYSHSLALKADGSVVLWGGISPAQTNLPTGLHDVSAIAAGYNLASALVSDGPPFLLTPIVSRSVVHDTRVSMFAGASGAAPITYQWRMNGSMIAGATNAVLTIDRVQFSDAGDYSVVVSNTHGSLTSAEATLEVVPLRIAFPPRGMYTFRGDDIRLSVTMDDPGPFHYQWRRNGADLPGATAPTLELFDAQPHQSGNYAIFITNAIGSVISPIATVSIGEVAVWGEPNNDTIYQLTEVPIGMTNVLAVAAGAYHNLALKRDGTVVAWGDNRYGQSDPPSGLSNVVSIAAGYQHNLALLADGTVVAWPTSASATPPQGLDQVVAIAAGNNCSSALRADGTVVSWGYTDVGTNEVPPGLGNIVGLAMFHYTSLGLTRDGRVFGWGRNSRGQANTPPLTDAVAIGVGTDFSVAARANGSLYVWGDTSILGPTPGLTDAIAVVCGEAHALALTQRGGLVQWGYDGFLGHEMAVPPRLRNVTAISAGRHHHLALVGEDPPVPPTLWPIPVWSTDAFTIILPSRSGKVYALEYLDSLAAPAWTALPLAAGHGDPLTLTDSNGPHRSARFYRVGQW